MTYIKSREHESIAGGCIGAFHGGVTFPIVITIFAFIYDVKDVGPLALPILCGMCTLTGMTLGIMVGFILHWIRSRSSKSDPTPIRRDQSTS